MESGTYSELTSEPDSVFSQFVSVIKETGVEKIEESEHFDAPSSPVARRKSSVKLVQREATHSSVIEAFTIARRIVRQHTR